MTVLYLDLPRLPSEIEQELLTVADSIGPDLEGIRWFEEFHDNKIKASSNSYGRHDPLDPYIYKEIDKIYGKYFVERITPIIGKAENIYKSGTTVHPPHCDRFRRTGVNYIIKTGGDNVLTCFYKEYRKNFDLSLSENSKFEDINLDFKIKFDAYQWNAFDVQQFHSVENIETQRISLHLLLESNPDFKTFQQHHKNIIKKV